MTEIFFAIAPLMDKAIMLILMVFSVLALGISLERYFVLKPLYRKSLQLGHRLKTVFKSGDMRVLESMGRDNTHPAGRAMEYGLAHIKNKGPEGLAELFKAVYLQEKPRLEGGISLLATIGANAPFVGLLGTVFGIMRSFHDLGLAVESASQQTVMTGISIALLATAMGLVVAIPSVMLYNYFQRRVNRILETVENVGETCLTYSPALTKENQKTNKSKNRP